MSLLPASHSSNEVVAACQPDGSPGSGTSASSRAPTRDAPAVRPAPAADLAPQAETTGEQSATAIGVTADRSSGSTLTTGVLATHVPATSAAASTTRVWVATTTLGRCSAAT